MTLPEVKAAVADLQSFITDGAIETYYKYANLIEDGIIVDLGTGWGKSFIALCLSNPTNKVCSTDTGDAPIRNGWAKDVTDYWDKLVLLRDEKGAFNGLLVGVPAEETMDQFGPETIDILHLDNWEQINNTDSTEMFERWFKKIKKGGYLLARNYGHESRPEYTASLDKATQDFTKLEKEELIQVYQK